MTTGMDPIPIFVIVRCAAANLRAGKILFQLAKVGRLGHRHWRGECEEVQGTGTSFTQCVSMKSSRDGSTSTTAGSNRRSPRRQSTYKQARGDNQDPRKDGRNAFWCEAPRLSDRKHKQFVLVSRHFYYFGAKAVPFPEEFKREKPEGFKLEKEKAVGSAPHFDPRAHPPVSTEWLQEHKLGKHGGSRAGRPQRNRGATNLMQHVVLLRVGIDTGSGGIHGPLFSDRSIEYIPIPDRFGGKGVDKRTYGNTRGAAGRTFADYFPKTRREKIRDQSIHFDPEFVSFTYGDPTPPKSSLSELTKGSLLVFYAGLAGWNFECPPGLYIVGFFEVARAGVATSFSAAELEDMFRNNFHVMHRNVFEDQKNRLVLVRGSANSRLLQKAVKISAVGADKNGRALHRLAPENAGSLRRIWGPHEHPAESTPRWSSSEEFNQKRRRICSGASGKNDRADKSYITSFML